MGSSLNGNPDWSLVFAVLTAVFSFCALLTEIYYRVYRTRTKDKEQKRKEVYKPLLTDIDVLVEKVRKKEVFSPPFNWKTVEEKVSTRLYGKLQKLFQEKVDNYYKLLKHNQNFIRYFGYFYLNSNLSKLQKEYLGLGVGGLEFELYESIVTPILEGEKITLRWLEDNKPELYENLAKCPSYKTLKGLLDWLNEENPCIASLRKAEQDVLKSAEELKVELKKF